MNTTKKASVAAAAGVDRGGTWTRLSCVSPSGQELRGTRFPTSELGQLAARLEKEFKKLNIGTDLPLVIATRGAFSKKWKRDFLFKAARGRFNLLNVISDAEAAHFAAFGGKTGLLLIAGTGAVAFYRDRAGRLIKTGGNNPESGDPGSGRWLGNQYLTKQGKAAGKRGGRAAGRGLGLSHARTAAYAAVLLAAAEQKGGWERELIERAQNKLATLIAKSLSKTPKVKKIKVALTGGLTENGFFRRGLIKKIRARSRARLVFTAPRVTAQTAAARMALAAYKKGKKL